MIKVDIQGQQRLELVLRSLTKSLDPTEILDEAGALMLSRTMSRFLKQVNPDGTPWLPSKASLKRKAKGRGGGTLFNTGKLFHSIQLAGSGSVDRFIGSNVPYGKFHQYGQGQVERAFLGFGQSDVTVVQRLIIKRVEDHVSGL